MKINNLTKNLLELHLEKRECSLLHEAVSHYSAFTEEQRELDVIPAICTTLGSIASDDEDPRTLYVGTVDLSILEAALHLFASCCRVKNLRPSRRILQNMITALEVAKGGRA